jgi:protein-S-isoprenylcysteine O-methyltransferase Ste14
MSSEHNVLSRMAAFVYGAVAYCFFFGTILYAIGFVGNVIVPKSIDSGAAGNVGFAIVINSLLLALFALQHSIMARPGFKRWWTRFVPKAVERSTFVLLASLVLILLFVLWRPIPTVFWEVQDPLAAGILYALSATGWLIVFVTTFLINHFDLFGLRQVYLHLVGKPNRPVPFRTTGFYVFVRHPLMLGFIIAFWATPIMTLGHLLFAGMTTIYILAAIQLEERDLENFHGEVYRIYRQRVPMLLPLRGASGQGIASDDAALVTSTED